MRGVGGAPEGLNGEKRTSNRRRTMQEERCCVNGQAYSTGEKPLALKSGQEPRSRTQTSHLNQRSSYSGLEGCVLARGGARGLCMGGREFRSEGQGGTSSHSLPPYDKLAQTHQLLQRTCSEASCRSSCGSGHASRWALASLCATTLRDRGRGECRLRRRHLTRHFGNFVFVQDWQLVNPEICVLSPCSC